MPDSDTLKLAKNAYHSGKLTLRDAAKMFKVDKSTLSRRITKGSPIKKGGGQLSIPKNSELELADCLKVKARWGFSESTGISEVTEHVKLIVNANIAQRNELGDYLKKY